MRVRVDAAGLHCETCDELQAEIERLRAERDEAQEAAQYLYHELNKAGVPMLSSAWPWLKVSDDGSESA